jgi:hypothetical protein
LPIGVGTIYNFDMFYNRILSLWNSRKRHFIKLFYKNFNNIHKTLGIIIFSFPIIVIWLYHFINEIFCFIEIVKWSIDLILDYSLRYCFQKMFYKSDTII